MSDYHSETKALQNLFNSSKRRETLEKVISIKDWDEVCSWQRVIPMCRYTQKSGLKGKKKKATNKLRNLGSGPGGNNNYDKFVGSTATNSIQKGNLQQLSSGSTSKDTNRSNRHKNYELPHLKEVPSDYSGANGHNKYLKSTNVLSYDVPSWRFLVDSERFHYIERSPPKDKVYNLLSRCMSSQHSTGSTKVLDPAGFLDERITHAYKSYQTFQPNQHVMELFRRLSAIPIPGNTQEIHDRLYYRSVISNSKGMFDEGESDGNEKSINNSKVKNTSKRKKKKSKLVGSKSKSKKNKTCYLPQLSNKQPSKEHNHGTEKKSYSKKPSIDTIDATGDNTLIISSSTKNATTTTTEDLYLPLLNYSNYNSKIQYIKRADVKLPPVAGIKMYPASTSNTSLVL